MPIANAVILVCVLMVGQSGGQTVIKLNPKSEPILSGILSVTVREAQPQETETNDPKDMLVATISGPVIEGENVSGALVVEISDVPNLRAKLHVEVPSNVIKTDQGPVRRWYTFIVVSRSVVANCIIDIQLIGRDPRTVQSYQIPIKQFMPPTTTTGPGTTAPGGNSPNQPVGPGGGQ